MITLPTHSSSTFENDPNAPLIAAIDLGTNSCRLLIARAEKNSFRIIDAYSKVVRLGEGITKSGVLSQEAMERAYEALTICRDKILDHRVVKFRAVTTEACRVATNASDFVERVNKDLKLNLEIIPQEEEARLALSGCSGIMDNRFPFAIAFDIGGGSTEVMWIRLKNRSYLPYKEQWTVPYRSLDDFDVIDWVSLPYGVVTNSEYDETKSYQNLYRNVRHDVNNALCDFSRRNRIPRWIFRRKVQMVGTSGTVTTLAAIQHNLERYDRRLIDGMYLSFRDIRAVSHTVRTMSVDERIAHPCIGPGRSDLVIIGTAILEGICDTWKLNRLRVADRGVREGILIDLLQEINKDNDAT
jgi:exopolyphosphatase/guanosine-5'-triphosphate,3'-diphosphate pyrophosphatase